MVCVQLLRAIRETFPMFALPVLVLSGTGVLEHVCISLESGASAFVQWCAESDSEFFFAMLQLCCALLGWLACLGLLAHALPVPLAVGDVCPRAMTCTTLKLSYSMRFGPNMLLLSMCCRCDSLAHARRPTSAANILCRLRNLISMGVHGRARMLPPPPRVDFNSARFVPYHHRREVAAHLAADGTVAPPCRTYIDTGVMHVLIDQCVAFGFRRRPALL